MNNSFESLALEWHEHKKPNWSSGYADDILEYLRKDIFPYIGRKAISRIIYRLSCILVKLGLSHRQELLHLLNNLSDCTFSLTS